MLKFKHNPPAPESDQTASDQRAAELSDLKMESLVRSIWLRSKPTAVVRIALLRDAIATMQQAGALTEEQRDAAVSAAHNLAGVLGTFGFPKGTEAARGIELLLETGPATSATAEAIRPLVSALEQIVP